MFLVTGTSSCDTVHKVITVVTRDTFW